MGRRRLDLIGLVFGRLTVVAAAEDDVRGRPRFLCVCECVDKTERVVTSNRLLMGQVRSCGCLAREQTPQRSSTHGQSRPGQVTPEYAAWCRMLQRCNNPNNASYSDYGGRGIRVCPEWEASFETFFAHVGPRPSPEHSLDRWPNADGNYEPGNVRWATPREQQNNKRNNRLITINGEMRTLSEWVRISGVSRQALYRRIKEGWPPEQLLSPPSEHHQRNGRLYGLRPYKKPQLPRERGRTVEINGQVKTVAQLARESGIGRQTIRNRINLAWPSSVLLIPAGANSLSYLTMTAEGA
jgi:hypothetical protein